MLIPSEKIKLLEARTAKRLIPVESTRLTVSFGFGSPALRLLNQRFTAKMYVFVTIVRDPPAFLVFGQHSSEAADFGVRN